MPGTTNFHKLLTRRPMIPLPRSTPSTCPQRSIANEAKVIGGHKANLQNPRTSEESKERSRRILEEKYDGGDTAKYSSAQRGLHNSGNIAGGLKATMSNPNNSKEAKIHAKERLENEDFQMK